MGNSAYKGFSKPPDSYLKEIRKKTNRHMKDVAKAKRRRSSSITSSVALKRSSEEPKKIKGELNKKSVVNYLMENPDFLDNLVIKHISQDRIKTWLQAGGDSSGYFEKDENDPAAVSNLMERSFRDRQIMLITRSRLLYPARFKRDELNELIERTYSDQYEDDIESHLFPYTEIPTNDINKTFIFMVTKLLGKYSFPMAQLCYFLSCLRSNYYNIEYHNYNHALSHAQSMYWILRRNPGLFNELEMKCLLVSAIAHDVAHPGINDSYLKATGNGLEKLYESPILEHHHTQTCFLILQDINCNVFCNLDGDDYKQVLDEIKHDMLSTSLARYKVQCETMRHLLATDLNFDKKKVRDSVKSVLMMTCDLCANWKQWHEHKSTVWALYKEFFNQGDKETSFNLPSAPQMMRTNADKIPEYQVSFLKNIVFPVFHIAVKVLPNIKDIIGSTKENLELWNTYL